MRSDARVAQAPPPRLWRDRFVLTFGVTAMAGALLTGAAARPPVENREIRIFRVANGMLERGNLLVPR